MGKYPGVQTLEDYLESLASAAPTPGGGSAATIVGAIAAALVAMVARITLRGAKSPALADDAQTLAGAADALRAHFLAGRIDDERAYAEVVAAMALPRGSEDEKLGRKVQLQAALREAARAPLHSAALARDALALAVRARALQNAALMSDVACATTFASAALEAAAANVRINHAYMTDPALIQSQEGELAALEREAGALIESASGA